MAGILSIFGMSSYRVKESAVTFRIEAPSIGELIPDTGIVPLQLDFSGVSISCGDKVILKDVYGKAKPGEILAIMGPSGSGKTTLLKGLSGRSVTDAGLITLNGLPLNKDRKRFLAVVEQKDLFMQDSSLRKTLRLHATLRLPTIMTKEQKNTYVDLLAKSLNIDHILDTPMSAVSGKGPSGGELKRTSIACEMLSNPSVLFVDEPTSGLDSHNALNVIQLLKKYAYENQRTVVITVHQPSSLMFQLFDKLLLLFDGKVAYFGNRSKVLERFDELQMTIQPNYNPADFIIDQLYIRGNLEKILEASQYPKGLDDDQDENDRLENNTLPNNNKSTNGNLNPPMDRALIQMFVMADQNKGSSKTTVNLGRGDSGRLPMLSNTGHSSSASLESISSSEKWPATFWEQLCCLVTERHFNQAVNRHSKGLQWIHTLILSAIVSGLWFFAPKIEENLDAIKGFMFFRITIWMLNGSFNCLEEFTTERDVVNRERASGMYRLSAYFCAKVVTVFPILLSHAAVFHFITYMFFDWKNPTIMFLQLGILLLGMLFAMSVGMFISAFVHDMSKALIVCALFAIPNMLFGGYFVPRIPFYFYWIKYSSSVNYAFQAMQIIEFQCGDSIRCAAENSVYSACVRNATFIPAINLISNEGEVFSSLFPNILVLIIGVAMFLGLAYLALRYYKSPTRTI